MRICCWNVAGLMNKFEETWDYLEKFDMIGLTETWVDEEKWKKIRIRVSSNFVRNCVPARKEHRKGRAKGGIINEKKPERGNRKGDR